MFLYLEKFITLLIPTIIGQKWTGLKVLCVKRNALIKEIKPSYKNLRNYITPKIVSNDSKCNFVLLRRKIRL